MIIRREQEFEVVEMASDEIDDYSFVTKQDGRWVPVKDPAIRKCVRCGWVCRMAHMGGQVRSSPVDPTIGVWLCCADCFVRQCEASRAEPVSESKVDEPVPEPNVAGDKKDNGDKKDDEELEAAPTKKPKRESNGEPSLAQVKSRLKKHPEWPAIVERDPRVKVWMQDSRKREASTALRDLYRKLFGGD